METAKNLRVLWRLLPQLIIFWLALVNSAFVWSHQTNLFGSGITFCAFCPWYHIWTPVYEPSILLFAAFLLFFRNRWSYLFAGLLSGYVVANVSLHLVRSISNFGLLELWEGLLRTEPSLFLVWEVQMVWAAIILAFVLFRMPKKLVIK